MFNTIRKQLKRSCLALCHTNYFSSRYLSNKSMERVQTTKDIIIDKNADILQTPKFSLKELRFTQIQNDDHEIKAYIQRLLQNNKNHNKQDILMRKQWNINYFDQSNYPLIIHEIKDKISFSKFNNNGHGIRFLDLPISMPDEGWHIPVELEQFSEMIQQVIKHEKILDPDFEKKYYVYITIDQKHMVKPMEAQRRKGWHSDSFLKHNNDDGQRPVDHIYIAYDSCPTPFSPGPFSLKDICTKSMPMVLNKFKEATEGIGQIYYPEYHILRIDPYCVHDVGINQSNIDVSRTFVKISVSPRRYHKLGNLRNPMFRYDWPLIPRDNVPYSFESIKSSSHRSDRDKFKEIDKKRIDYIEETFDTKEMKWAEIKNSKPNFLYFVRTSSVHAEPAIEGENLKSVNQGFLITICVAKKGDWKVTNSQGEQYFISEQKLHEYYYKNNSNTYVPKPLIRKAIKLTEDVRCIGPWDTLHYGRKGDYLMCTNDDDIYIIPKNVIAAEFRQIEYCDNKNKNNNNNKNNEYLYCYI